MVKVPKSLSEAIELEPERFAKYFKIKSIEKSKSPDKEFLKQFEKKFGKKQGLYLWNYILDNYDLTNKFYSFKQIQSKLPEKFKGNINKNVVNEFFNNYKEKISKRQDTREKHIKKNISVNGYSRNGKNINPYQKTANNYNEIQKNFILARKNEPLKRLADNFNQAFGTSITAFGIRDKRLRLLGKKK